MHGHCRQSRKDPRLGAPYRTYERVDMGNIAGRRYLKITTSFLILAFVAGCKLQNSGDDPSLQFLNSLLASDTSQPVGNESITILWQAPFMNDDGTPLVDLVGYRIYIGQAPGVYDSVVKINNVGIMSYVLSGLVPGTYYVAMTSVNSAGVESAPSTEVERVVG